MSDTETIEQDEIKDFTEIDPEQAASLDEFADEIALNSFTRKEIVDMITSKPDTQFYLFGITTSALLISLLKLPNTVAWWDGHGEKNNDKEFQDNKSPGVTTVTEYIDWINYRGEKAIFVISPDIFTYFTRNPTAVIWNYEFATIRELNHLLKLGNFENFYFVVE